MMHQVKATITRVLLSLNLVTTKLGTTCIIDISCFYKPKWFAPMACTQITWSMPWGSSEALHYPGSRWSADGIHGTNLMDPFLKTYINILKLRDNASQRFSAIDFVTVFWISGHTSPNKIKVSLYIYINFNHFHTDSTHRGGVSQTRPHTVARQVAVTCEALGRDFVT